MMRLFIMRHGEAAPMAATDSERCLTQWGEQQSQQVGRWFQQQQIQIDHVLVSPYVRAQQTWQGVASQLQFNGTVLTDAALRPGGRVESVVLQLEPYCSIESCNVLVVSHLPMVGYLVHTLCRQVNSPMFATAAVAELILEDTSGAAMYCGMRHIA